MTKIYEFSFNIIPKGNNSLILKPFNEIKTINYQFIKCSNYDINFTLDIIDQNKVQSENYIINDNLFLQKNFDKSQNHLKH